MYNGGTLDRVGRVPGKYLWGGKGEWCVDRVVVMLAPNDQP